MREIVFMLLSAFTVLITNAHAMLECQTEGESNSQRALSIRKINTSSGTISYMQSEGEGEPIVFIHNNSASKGVFQKQFEKLGQKYKMIALDLPGHGESSNSDSPEKTYSFPGYAKVVTEVVEGIGLDKAVFCGWSLGGHVGIEILNQRPDLVSGLMITGTPPIPLTPEGMAMGFQPFEGIDMMGQKTQFSEPQLWIRKEIW